jgi:hypothetical protein
MEKLWKLDQLLRKVPIEAEAMHFLDSDSPAYDSMVVQGSSLQPI